MLDLGQNHSIVTGPQHPGDTGVTSGQLCMLRVDQHQKLELSFIFANWIARLTMILTGMYQWIAQASQVALVVRNPPIITGGIRDTGSIPVLGRSSGGGHGNSFQYSCLENPMDRGAWRATVHGVTKSQTWLKQLGRHHGISISHVINQ